MRKYFIVGLLFLATIAPEGCIFEPRTADPPESGTNQYPWIVPNMPKDVFVNLKSGLASNLDSNYERSLDPEFAFIPFDDAEAVYPLSFADWTKVVELTVLARIKTLYFGERSVQFGDANLHFPVQIEDQPRLAIYEGPYTITLNPGDGSPAVIYAGEARFTIVQGTQGWVLSIWEDIGQIPGNSNSGMLRGALRILP